MGFVSDDSNSDTETTLMTPNDEEESLISERSPALDRQKENSNRTHYDNHTPTTKDNDLLSVTRLRREGMTEADEIWGELEDDTPIISSPFSNRRSSAKSTPSRLRSSGAMDDNDGLISPHEGTALLERSGTGRNYRDRRRRRSMPSGGGDRRRESQAQGALGGWWKMSWWRGHKKEGKGKVVGGNGENQGPNGGSS